MITRLALCVCATILCDSAVAQRPELVVQTGHTVGVTALAFSADGRILATGGFDRSILLWDVETGRQIRTMAGHGEAVTALRFMNDGSLLSASWDGTVRRWDLQGLSEPTVEVSVDGEITRMVVSSTGRRIAAHGFEGSLRLWTSGESKPDTISGQVLAGGDGIVLVAKDDSTVSVISVESGVERHRIPRFANRGKVIVSDRAGLIAFADRDHNLKVLSLETGAPVATVENPGGTPQNMFAPSVVTEMVLAPDGRQIATGSYGGEIVVYDSRTGVREWSRTVCKDDNLLCEVNGLSFSASGGLLATGFRSGEIVVWSTATGEPVSRLVPTTSIVRDLDFGSETGVLASGAEDGLLRLWDFRLLRDLRPAAEFAHGVQSVSVRGDDEEIALTVGDLYSDRETWLWRTGTDSLKTAEEALPSRPVYAAGDSIIASIDRGGISLLDAQSLAPVKRLERPGSEIYTFAFVSEGAQLVSVDGEGSVLLWDVKTGSFDTVGSIESLQTDGIIDDLQITDDGRTLVLAGGVTVLAVDLVDRRVLWQSRSEEEYVRSLAIDPGNELVASAGADGVVRLWSLSSGEMVQELSGHSTWLSDVEFSPDGRFLATTGGDTTIRFWRRTGPDGTVKFEASATLFGFRDGTWAAVDPQGRFDGSNGGEIDGLHWIIDDEVVALEQLKDRYYEPGLMQKILGYSDEPLRDVSSIREREVELWPALRVSDPNETSGRLEIDLADRGGGMGRIVVRINGKEATSDARPRGFPEHGQNGELSIDIASSPFLIPGEDNEIEVIAYNADGYLHSRGVTRPYRAAEKEELPPVTLWALVAGVSNYRGEELDLAYAAQDAHDFANALAIGGEKLFEGRVRITLLSSDVETPEASRENILQALREMDASSPTDIVVIYLAGHGIVHGAGEGDFYYLTHEAASGDLSDPVVRSSTTVSGSEINGLLSRVPALKQVLILDTCHSGGIVPSLGERRSLPPSRRHALERMKDRNSIFVLAGSAADAVSYEASRYGQGLLTYSLLMGMKGASLRDGAYVDVSRLFDFARDRVPQLAQGIGGIQEPIIAVPRGGDSFDIGELDARDRERIPLSVERPLILRASFQDREFFDDHLDLAGHVNRALRAAGRGDQPTLFFVDARDFEDGYRIAGQYTVTDGRVDVVARVFTGHRDQVAEVAVSGSEGEVESLARNIVDDVAEVLLGSRP